METLPRKEKKRELWARSSCEELRWEGDPTNYGSSYTWVSSVAFYLVVLSEEIKRGKSWKQRTKEVSLVEHHIHIRSYCHSTCTLNQAFQSASCQSVFFCHRTLFTPYMLYRIDVSLELQMMFVLIWSHGVGHFGFHVQNWWSKANDFFKGNCEKKSLRIEHQNYQSLSIKCSVSAHAAFSSHEGNPVVLTGEEQLVYLTRKQSHNSILSRVLNWQTSPCERLGIAAGLWTL